VSEIVAVPYEPKHRPQWDDFVLRSNNGTMFHLQRFLDYHPPGEFQFAHLLFLKGHRLVAVLPGGLTAAGVYESPVGASYGGFVLHDPSFDDCLRLVDALLAYAEGAGWNDVSLTGAPYIYQATLTQNIDFALLWRGFAYDCHYISSVIDLHRHGDDPLPHYSESTRLTVRRGRSSSRLQIAESTDFDTFYPILVENKARHGAKPTHSLEDIYRLKELLPDRFVFYSASLDGEMIAGALNFVANPRVLLVFYPMMRYSHQQHRPIYALMDRVVRHALENGFSYVDIGVSQDTKAANPMTPSVSLIRFKERFDSRGVMRSTLRWRRPQ